MRPWKSQRLRDVFPSPPHGLEGLSQRFGSLGRLLSDRVSTLDFRLRAGRVADSTLEPTLERTPQVDAASEDPKEDRSDSNTGLPHSTIRRSSQYSLNCRKPAARWCEESGLLKAPPPIWSACSPRWPSLRSRERMSSRSDNVPRSYTGAYRRDGSSMPRSRDFKTALLDPRSWRSTRA